MKILRTLYWIISDSFSKHFKLAFAALVIVSLALIFAYHKVSARIERAYTGLVGKTSFVLPSNDKEEILVNALKHTVTIITPTKTTVEYANNPVIQETKNGQIIVTRNVVGFEMVPALGVSYSDKLRFAFGCDVFHLYRFELGASGLLANGPNTMRVGVTIGYNVWDNTSLFVGIDNYKEPIGGLSLKF